MADRPSILFSASEAFYPAAVTELKGMLAGEPAMRRLGGEAGLLTGGGDSLHKVARACRERPCVFVRHLSLVHEIVPQDEDIARRVADSIPAMLAQRKINGPVAMQLWSVAEAPRTDWNALRQTVLEHLRGQGVLLERGGCRQIVHLCQTNEGIVIGHARLEDALADWPGGRVTLAKLPEQVSRAEFKLEECLRVFGITLPQGGLGIDLGASPGGWTRVLRKQGLQVYAVDPGQLDERVARDTGVTHLRTTAGVFFAEHAVKADVIVNDMKMAPELSCGIMVSAASALKTDGLAIMTLKLNTRQPLKAVASSLARLRQAYAILHARQLFHNRDEVTVVMRPLAYGRRR